MAKITDIKFNLNNKDYIIPVNVNSKGEFKTELPREIATALKIQSQINSSQLNDVLTVFYSALDKYKKAQTIQQLFIAISYGSSGQYNRNAGGGALHNSNNSKYQIRQQFGGLDCIGFEFDVIILESVDGIGTYYTTRKGDPTSIFQDRKNEDPERYYKNREAYNMDKYKLIPFNEIHLSTLMNAQENLRKLSEMLFNFIEQDEEQIKLTLQSGRLMLNTKN